MHHLQIDFGIYTLKSELEDLGFKYLLPDEYNKIVMDLNKRKEHREEYLNNIKKQLLVYLKKERIKCDITGRTKHIYSIYKKLKRDNVTIDQVYDIFALRIIVNDVATCYRIFYMKSSHQ